MKIIKLAADYYRKNSIYLLLSILLFIISIFVLYTLTDEIVLEKETGFDDYIFQFFKDFIVHQRLNNFIGVITNFSAPKLMVYFFPLMVVLLALFKQKRKAIFLFISGAGGLILLSVLKYIFARKRPLSPLLFPEDGFSFPSGHATFSFIFYGALAYLVWFTDLPKTLKVVMSSILVLLSLLIGISRIYLRVHFPSDVLAGFCLGYSWLFLVIYFFRKRFPLH